MVSQPAQQSNFTKIAMINNANSSLSKCDDRKTARSDPAWSVALELKFSGESLNSEVSAEDQMIYLLCWQMLEMSNPKTSIVYSALKDRNGALEKAFC